MKRFLTATQIALFLVAMAAPAQPLSPSPARTWSLAQTPLRIEGRFARGENDAIRLGFPGVTLHLRFHGSVLAFRVKASSDEVYFNLFVDGGPLVRLRAHAGEGVYPILTESNAADHTVEIVRRSESWQGTCEILGFTTAQDDRFLPAPAAPSRRLQFIGDSITCGASADTRSDDPLNGKTHDHSHTSNASATFAKILAQRFHADCHLVSYGGRGLIRDWQGIRDTPNAPQFYELALPDDPTAKWDQSAYVPDAIGICLGQNDFNQGIPDENEFVNSFVQFIQKIRRDSPQAFIWLIQSPIIEDKVNNPPRRSVLAAYLREVISRLHDPKIMFAPIPHYPGVPNDGHPAASDHLAMANELEPLFRQALGW